MPCPILLDKSLHIFLAFVVSMLRAFLSTRKSQLGDSFVNPRLCRSSNYAQYLGPMEFHEFRSFPTSTADMALEGLRSLPYHSLGTSPSDSPSSAHCVYSTSTFLLFNNSVARVFRPALNFYKSISLNSFIHRRACTNLYFRLPLMCLQPSSMV